MIATCIILIIAETDKRKDGFLYSARLYKGGSGFKNKAVFCMCQQHPQYTKVGTVEPVGVTLGTTKSG